MFLSIVAVGLADHDAYTATARAFHCPILYLTPSRAYGREQTWHDGNGHSHLQATLLGPGLTVPVRDGKLLRGAWQQIVHLECDVRPRQRTVVVTVLGE